MNERKKQKNITDNIIVDKDIFLYKRNIKISNNVARLHPVIYMKNFGLVALYIDKERSSKVIDLICRQFNMTIHYKKPEFCKRPALYYSEFLLRTITCSIDDENLVDCSLRLSENYFKSLCKIYCTFKDSVGIPGRNIF